VESWGVFLAIFFFYWKVALSPSGRMINEWKKIFHDKLFFHIENFQHAAVLFSELAKIFSTYKWNFPLIFALLNFSYTPVLRHDEIQKMKIFFC